MEGSKTVPTTTLSLIKVGALAISRAALGLGVGLLIADRMDGRTRMALGGTLLGVGAITTAPVVVWIVKGIGSRDAPGR
jgi:hypothetical protein